MPNYSPAQIDTLHLSDFESINGSWSYNEKNCDTINFNLKDNLKVQLQKNSFKKATLTSRGIAKEQP